MGDHSVTTANNGSASSREETGSTWVNAVALLLWLAAGVVAFIPFAYNTSAWDAVTFRVPGNQGNWWHFLAGAPFFLAYPMIWLRLRLLFSAKPLAPIERRVIWSAAGLSILGTILVEAPFLLHLAGTSEWQRFVVLSLGFGVAIASGTTLFLRRRNIAPIAACFIGLATAYLANAALCLVVYSEAKGSMQSRSGWLVLMVIIWPIVGELLWNFVPTSKTRAHAGLRAA